MQRLTRWFFEGLVFMAPIAVTVFVFYKLFVLIDEPTRHIAARIIGCSIPGIGFLVTVILAAVALTVIGFLCSSILARGALGLFDRLIERFPPVKALHGLIKDFLTAFVGEKKKFDQPVLVQLIPGSDVKAVGFMTRKSMDMWGMSEQVAVYLPQSFNLGGLLIIVPRERVTPLPAAGSDAMAFVISGGVAGSTGDPPKALAPAQGGPPPHA